MAPIFSLLVVVRVAIDIVQYDDASGRQIDSQTSCLRRKNEDEVRLVVVERVYQSDPAIADARILEQRHTIRPGNG